MAPSFISWLDHSERDRRRALDVVHFFKDQGTMDELGLGVIWEPIADLLFPGTSTIQTRARYFLFVPWIYLDLERKRTRPADIPWAARYAETSLISILLESDDNKGVIGRQAGKALKRLPSEIYWSGLEQWGIRLFRGSREQYHRYLASHVAVPRNDDGESAGGLRPNWHKVPEAPDDFPNEADLRLTSEEAFYLQDRIMHRHPDSLLAWLVEKGAESEVPFVWDHPQFGELPERLSIPIEHARCFSECINGASLLYNLLMARAIEDESLIGNFEDRVDEWAEEIEQRADELRTWDRAAFWRIVGSAGGRVATPTRGFVDRWLDLALGEPGAGKLKNDAAAKGLIANREHQMKGTRARLFNPRALELWGGNSGTFRLNYRWGTARDISNDIIEGLADA